LQELYRRLLQFTNDGVYRYTFEDGRLLMANIGLIHILELNCEPEAIIGRYLKDLMIYTEKEGRIRTELLKNNEIHEFEYHFKTLAGKDKWVIHDSFVVVDSATGEKFVEAIVKDITDRKVSEQTLKKAHDDLEIRVEERTRELRLMLEQIPALLWTTDKDLLITSVAGTALKDLNLQPDRMVGLTLQELFQTTDSSFPLIEMSLQALRGHPVSFEQEWQGYYYQTHIEPLHRPDKTDLGTIGVALDVTSLKQTEFALIAEKERLDVTLRSIGDGVIATDLKGNVVLINRVAENLTGWSQSEALNQQVTDVFHIINEKTGRVCENPVQKVLETDSIIGLANHTLLISKNGRRRVIADSGAPIRSPEGKIFGVVLVFRDVTEQHKLEEEIAKMHKLESVGILAGGIAHDFNNILSGIVGSAYLAKMLSLTNQNPAKVIELIVSIEKAVWRAKDLTQQLLTFARGGEPVKKIADLAELIKKTVNFTLSGSNVRGRFSFQPGIFNVEIDPGQIDQVFQNLTINAAEAMPQGGIIDIRGEIAELEETHGLPLPKGKYIKVAMHDRGGGIAPENIPLIFDPFFTTKAKGNGLGLTTTFNILKRHDGYITVESILGVGSTFTVYLPATDKQIEHRDDESDLILMKSGKILVMDDEEIIRETLQEILKNFGMQVEAVCNGEETLSSYLKAKEMDEPFDVVILDLTVPGGMGGKECLDKLKKLDPKVKAVVSSGYSNDPIMANYRDLGFAGIIMKPYSVEELSKTLIELILHK
jgi:PAS domain S-box-containing protein